MDQPNVPTHPYLLSGADVVARALFAASRTGPLEARAAHGAPVQVVAVDAERRTAHKFFARWATFSALIFAGRPTKADFCTLRLCRHLAGLTSIQRVSFQTENRAAVERPLERTLASHPIAVAIFSESCIRCVDIRCACVGRGQLWRAQPFDALIASGAAVIDTTIGHADLRQVVVPAEPLVHLDPVERAGRLAGHARVGAALRSANPALANEVGAAGLGGIARAQPVCVAVEQGAITTA